MTPQELIHSFEVAFDAAEGGHRDASVLRRQFISDFSTYFQVSERDLVQMGSGITLTSLDWEMDSIGDVRQRAIDSLARNLQRLKPGQPGVHEDVRRTEVAYCYKRILYSLTQVRHMAAISSKDSNFTESAGGVNPPPSWYEEAHGILDVILDEYIESDRPSVDRRLWDELEKALRFLHEWWRVDDRQSAAQVHHSMSGKWVRSSKTPREHVHQLLDNSIRNSLTDITAGYQQSNQQSWIVDNGKSIRNSISFTTPEEFQLSGEWAKRWNLDTNESTDDDAFRGTVAASPYPRHELDVVMDRAEEGEFDQSLWDQFTDRARRAFHGDPRDNVSPNLLSRRDARDYIQWNSRNAWSGRNVGRLRQHAQSQLEMMYGNPLPGFTPAETFALGLETIRKIVRAIAKYVSTNVAESLRIDEVGEDDLSYGAMSFNRPDTTGNRGGNPAASKTMSRSPGFPYDRQVTYGRQPQYHDPSGPFDGHGADKYPMNPWDLADGLLQNDPISEDVSGDMGEGGLSPDELELDVLKRAFRHQFDRTLPAAQGMDSPSLFVMLADMDPDYVAQTFAPEDDSEMAAIYGAWGERVAGPGEER